MAWGLTDRGTGNVTYATSATSASFTPAANSLLFAWAQSSNQADLTSIAGHGTWSQIGLRADTGLSSSLQLWVAKAGASPGAATIDILMSSRTMTFGFFEGTGHDETLTAANAVIQNVTGTQYNSGGGPYTLTLNLAAFASSTNLSLVVMGTPSNLAFTTEGGWTDLHTSASSTVFEGRVAYLPSADTTHQIGTSSGYTYMCGIGIEIAEAVVGGVNITNVDTDNVVTIDQQNIVVTGTGFEAEGANSKITLIDSLLNTHDITTFGAWTATSIEFDLPGFSGLTGTKVPIGACTLRVTNQSLATADQAITINVEAGHTSVTVASPGTDSEAYLAANFTPSAATGDILYHSNLAGLTVSPDTSFISNNGSFQALIRDQEAGGTGEWGDIATFTVVGSSVVTATADGLTKKLTNKLTRSLTRGL